jgi:hypothetical protein
MPCGKGLSSAALLKYVQDILVRCNMDRQKIAGMAFDGASAMKRLAFYIHCFAHCNELVLKNATSLSRMVADAQDFCEDMCALAGVSPKRVLLFKKYLKGIVGE